MRITTEDQLLETLRKAGIEYRYFQHPPVFTVEEAAVHCQEIPGAHVKNLFLRDHKKTAYLLVSLPEKKRLNLANMGERLGISRLSFASADDLVEYLGVQPGSVTPFAILNAPHSIPLFLDHGLENETEIAVHPMVNTATIVLKLRSLLSFIEEMRGKRVLFLGNKG